MFIDPLYSCCRSEDYGEVASAWNELRKQICEDAVKKFLMPQCAKWLKEHLRLQAEDFVADRCRMELEYVSISCLSTRAWSSDGRRKH